MNPIDVNHKFDLVPDTATGTRRAVMIGINYVGEYVIADNHSWYGNLQLSPQQLKCAHIVSTYYK